MTRDKLEDLAVRCEQAEGPDRELDADIALTLGIVRERDGDCFYGHPDHSVMVLERGYYDHGGNAPELPHYTASIDAALTLAPMGSLWALGSMEEGPFARLLWPNASGSYVGNYVETKAAAPPLALTAAFLRARARSAQ